MCLPAAIPAIGAFLANNAAVIGAVTSVASAGASAYGAQQSAQAQMDAAGAAADVQNQQLALQMGQIDDAAAQEAFERRRQTDRELGKFMAAAGASGVTGISLGRQQAAVGVNEQLDLGVIGTNRAARQQQAGVTGLGIQSQFKGRVGAAEASAPGALGSILSIGGAGLSGFGSGLQIDSALADRKATKKPGGN